MTIIKTQTRYLYTMRDFMEKPKIVEIDDAGIILSMDGQSIDPTPIEDYGDYLLVDAPVSEAFDEWERCVDDDSPFQWWA